jgi:hypothetical protein
MNKYLTMILPPLHGKLSQSDFFVYAAADSTYFDIHGRALINSVIRNTNYGVHLHLYNPTDAQLDFCNQLDRVSITWEYVAPQDMDSAIKLWSKPDLGEPYLSRRNKMLGIKVVDRSLTTEQNVKQWLFKTYYACMRFVRLSEMLTQPAEFLAIDVDGLVRKNFEYKLPDQKDFYLHEKAKGGHLAGAILSTGSADSLKFVQRHAAMIKQEIEQDNIFWFLDQWALDRIVNNYNKGYLPIDYIDWYMNPASAIWSAKGKRKDLEVFKQEQRKYI